MNEKIILIDLDDIESIKKGEKLKIKYENEGYQMTMCDTGFNTSRIEYTMED